MGRKRKVVPGEKYEFGGNAARARIAGSKAFDIILGLFATKKPLSAKDFCRLCRCMAEIGAPGADWKDWGGGSNLDESSAKRYLDARLPGSGPYYKAMIPCGITDSPFQKSREICFNQVWETMAQEVAESAHMQELMRDGATNNFSSPMSLPVYLENPLTQRSLAETGQWPLPLALYLDGVRFTPLCAGRSDPWRLLSVPS